MAAPIISTEGLTKIYRLYDAPIHRLKEGLNPFGRKYHKEFYALRDVAINVEQGQCVGIIGLNGSGKSTLLQLIAGVLTPTSGSVRVQGRIAALLELGAGFNPEFTGRENALFQCSIMGFHKQAATALLPDIAAFADIGEFLDHPVKTYSSGMYVRLAFAVAINVDPDVLIVDEALAVGDMRFQAKCMAKIREFRAAGKALLFVSHDPAAVKSLCSRAYLLDKGVVVDSGEPGEVFNYYNSLIAERETRSAPADGALKASLRHRSGDGRIRFESVRLLDEKGREAETLMSGAPARIELEALINADTDNPSFGILIRDRLGNDVFGTNNHQMAQPTGELKAGTRIRLTYAMPLNIGAGIYNITVAAHAGESHVEENYDWLNEALVFRIVLGAVDRFSGVCRLQPKLTIDAGGSRD